MPRKARQVSHSGVYHITVRGVNRADIFLEDEDYLKLLYVFKDVQEREDFQVYAYCLMTNHFHILLRTTGSLSKIMQRVLGRYVIWYNGKYERVGHLFQNRYDSRKVENAAYFLAAVQYIFNNPVKGGLCGSAIEYRWSNLRQWFWRVGGMPQICVPYEKLPARPCLLDTDIDIKNFEILDPVSDAKVRRWALEILDLQDWRQVQDVAEGEMRLCVAELLKRGCRVRSLSRVLGMTRCSVTKIMKQLVR